MTDLRRIVYDTDVQPPPAPGDFLVCMSRRTDQPTGTVYQIVTARTVQRREERPETRFAFGVLRTTFDEIDWSKGVHGLVWNPRK